MVSLVQVQTLRGTQGKAEALKSVEAAVAKYNAENAGAEPHIVQEVVALPNNVKGMQWQLALLATLARQADVTMIRLNVHNGHVALCGTPDSIETVSNLMRPSYDTFMTRVSQAYDPAAHGNRVGFTNGWLCGAVAGFQDATGVEAELQYGIGFLFSFPKPGNGSAYDLGYEAMYQTIVGAVKAADEKVAEETVSETKARRTRKPKTEAIAA
jgi:hypothetical protein